jgi:hypothetical protein
MMMVGTTLWLSSMTDLPPEGYAFYLIWSRATMLGIMYVLLLLALAGAPLADTILEW